MMIVSMQKRSRLCIERHKKGFCVKILIEFFSNLITTSKILMRVRRVKETKRETKEIKTKETKRETKELKTEE